MKAGKILFFALGTACLFLAIRWSATLPFLKLFIVFAIGVMLITLSNISKLTANGILRSSTLVKILYNTENGQPRNYFFVGFFLIISCIFYIILNISLTSNNATQELILLFKERLILFTIILVIIILLYPLLFKIKLEQIIVTTKRQNRVDEDAASWGVIEKNNYIYKPTRSNSRIFELYSPEESVFLGKDYYYGINSIEISQEAFDINFNLGGKYKGDIKISLNDDNLRKCRRISAESLSVITDYAPQHFRKSIQQDLDNCLTEGFKNLLKKYNERVNFIKTAVPLYLKYDEVKREVLLKARTEFDGLLGMFLNVNDEFSKDVTDYINLKISKVNYSQTPIHLFKVSCSINDLPLLKEIQNLALDLSTLIKSEPGLDDKRKQLARLLEILAQRANPSFQLLEEMKKLYGFDDNQSFNKDLRPKGNNAPLNAHANNTKSISADETDLLVRYTRLGTDSLLFREKITPLLENRLDIDDFISMLNEVSGFNEMNESERRIKINQIINRLIN